MSCPRQRLRDIDTTIYNNASRCGCDCDDKVTIQFVERPCPCCPWEPIPPVPPFPPFPPFPPVPPVPPVPVPVINPTNSYAYFYNSTPTGVAYATGSTIPFPTTLANTDETGIINNNGVLTLTGGENGRAYLINYKLTGSALSATVGLVINGANDTSTNLVFNNPTETLSTQSGSYILTVPANTTSTVALNVLFGTVTTGTPTTGTSISAIRIA